MAGWIAGGRKRRAQRVLVAVAACGCAVLVAAAGAHAAVWLPAADLSVPQTSVGCGFLGAQPGAGGIDVAVDSRGNAVAAWTRRDNANNQIVQASFRPAGGAFGPPQDVGISRGCYFLGILGPIADVALDDQGTAVLVWPGISGPNTVVQAAVRPPGGAFGPPIDLSDNSQSADSDPRVAMSRSGHAVAVWSRSDGDNDVIQASSRPPGGTFGLPANLSGLAPAGADATSARVAVNEQGAAAVAWVRLVGGNDITQVRVRPAGGSFAAEQSLTAAGQDAQSPDVAIDPQGRATVVWNRSDGTQSRAESRFLNAAGASPSGTDLLSNAGVNASTAQVALDSENTAVAVWIGCPTGGGSCVIESASRPSNGSFSDPAAISPPADSNVLPKVAVTPSGSAIAAWSELGTSGKVQSAARPKGGTFGGVADISSAGGFGVLPSVAVDDEGSALAGWAFLRDSGGGQTAQAAIFDAGAPALTSLAVPGTGTTGVPVGMSASAFDRFSGAALSWSFGDGTGGAGGSVAHAYGAPGVYTVTTTAQDAAGNAVSATRTIQISDPPPPPPPQPTPRIAGVTLSYDFQAFRPFTRLTRIQVKRVPRGSTVRAVCALKKKKCPGKARKAFTKRNARGTVSLNKRFKGVRLRVGTTLTVRVTKPGFIGAAKILKVRKGKAPQVTDRCMAVGSTRLRRSC
jgi:PKD domain-containing protein